MKGKILLIFTLTFLMSVHFASAVDDYCVYCGEKEYTFTKSGLDLETTNTLKIVGHDTHGVTYISISCEIEDTGPPTTSIDPDGKSWTKANVPFTLTCVDDSGCEITYYKVIDDGEVCGITGFSSGTSGSVACDSGQVCKKRVCYYSVDTVGNEESMKMSKVFYIDKTKPFTSVKLSGTEGGSEWYRSDVQVELECSDTGSDCKVTKYCVDTENACNPSNTYSSPFVVSDEGVVYVRYYSKDKAGNEETVKSKKVKIDKTGPSTSINPDGRPWTNSNVPFTLICSDSHSLCKNTYYKVIDDGDTCGSYGYSRGNSGMVTCSSGNTCRKRVCYYSEDNAGNVEETKVSEIFYIDREVPTVSVTGNPQDWQNADIDAYVTCYDSGSGCDEESYRLKIYNLKPSSCPQDYAQYDRESPYTISEYSWVCGVGKDRVGNVGFSSPIEFKVDKNPPTPSILNPAVFVTKDSVGLEWSENEDKDFSHYEVHYSQREGFTPEDETLAVVVEERENTSFVVEGLEKDNVYYFKIVTVDETGLSSESNEISETTWECNPGETRPCGSDIGECETGVRTCNVDGKWGECVGYVGPEDEICDGKDNDCDGTIDNVDGGDSVEETKCACYGGDSYPGELEEECNGIDDDCDGEIDEDVDCECMDGETRPCGSNIGECSNGTSTCVNGKWGECVGYVGPEDEICDGKDNDCDGTIDNVDGGDSVEETKCACYGGDSYPGELEEECNGIDDDCDGEIDEDVDCECMDGETRPCGSNIGECSNGTSTCVNGKWGECVGYVGPRSEVCNGKDDDCDGVIDNVYGGDSVEETKCACYGGFSLPGVKGEKCNRIDDDCDGTIDEGCPRGSISAGPSCSNRIQDGDEEGIDCGGSCPPCPRPPEVPEWMWLIVFLVLVVVIAVVGVLLVFIGKR